jgi:hypothetical protein
VQRFGSTERDFPIGKLTSCWERSSEFSKNRHLKCCGFKAGFVKQNETERNETEKTEKILKRNETERKETDKVVKRNEIPVKRKRNGTKFL